MAKICKRPQNGAYALEVYNYCKIFFKSHYLDILSAFNIFIELCVPRSRLYGRQDLAIEAL